MYTKYVDNVELYLYEDDRHELHSETDREDIFSDYMNGLKKMCN